MRVRLSKTFLQNQTNMTLSFILFIMTLVAVGVVIGPLVRPTKINSALSGNELEIHKNQLEDIDRDLELRLITSAEADLTRVEIHRRILSSSANQRALKPTSRRKIFLVAIIIGLCVPTTSLIIYLQIGRPDLAIEPTTSEHMVRARVRTINTLQGEFQNSPEAWKKILDKSKHGYNWERFYFE